MTDIVERLRAGFFCREEAADEIERLQEAKRRALAVADERSKENVALRKALEQIASLYPGVHGYRATEIAKKALASVVGTSGSDT